MTTNNENERQVLFNKILNLIKNNPSGFTANAHGKKLNVKNGYAVSLTNNKEKDINLLINKVLSLNERLNFNFGGWKDKTDNSYYLDLSIIEPSRMIAESIAKEFNQKAVFDFKTLTEIRV